MDKGDVVNVELSDQGGHEQYGNRPAIAIVSRQMLARTHLVIIVPTTHELKRLNFPHTFQIDPSPENGLSIPSVALVFQLRVVDIRKIDIALRGHLEGHYMKQLDDELRRMLGL